MKRDNFWCFVEAFILVGLISINFNFWYIAPYSEKEVASSILTIGFSILTHVLNWDDQKYFLES